MRLEQQEEKEELLAKRDALLARLNAINKDYQQGLNPDSEERAVELQNAEVLDAIARAASDELDRIEKRLAALEGKST